MERPPDPQKPAAVASLGAEQAAEADSPLKARFPASVRLLKHADFERVYKQGQRQFSTNLTVFFLGRSEGKGARVGFTVSRALGGAVDRNRMKRRLREAVRLHLNLLKKPTDVVINPKRSVLRVEFGQILAEIERAFAAVEKRWVTMKADGVSQAAPMRAKRPSGRKPGIPAQRVVGKKQR